LSADTLGSLAALAAAGVFAYHGAGLTAATLAIAASGLATAPLVDRWLRRAARAAADTDTDTRADAPCVA
jgi:membrane protein implicated in regulation of membrane protease activity